MSMFGLSGLFNQIGSSVGSAATTAINSGGSALGSAASNAIDNSLGIVTPSTSTSGANQTATSVNTASAAVSPPASVVGGPFGFPTEYWIVGGIGVGAIIILILLARK